jgi:hypothetical protein
MKAPFVDLFTVAGKPPVVSFTETYDGWAQPIPPRQRSYRTPRAMSTNNTIPKTIR